MLCWPRKKHSSCKNNPGVSSLVNESTSPQNTLGHLDMIQLPLPTYQQSRSCQQGLGSTHSQCTPHSFPSPGPDLSHSCRMLLNHLLCQCSLSQIHSVGFQVDHSQLKETVNLLETQSTAISLWCMLYFGISYLWWTQWKFLSQQWKHSFMKTMNIRIWNAQQ